MRYITALITPKGLYQWKRVPFGLCSESSCFQKIIREITPGLDGITNLLDDIVVIGYGNADHDGKVDAVLNTLRKSDATLTYDKWEFGVAALHFAGFTIDQHGVRPLPSNADALLKIPAPTAGKERHSFLCTATYYLRFVSPFATIAEQLAYLLRKDIPWVWTSECEAAFKFIKEEIASNRVLCHFAANVPTLVSTDASTVVIGAVLSQLQHGEERPVAFASRTLNNGERAYSAGEREALVCICACEHWHSYLYGRHFTLLTDHLALSSLFSASRSGRRPMRLLRWAERLNQYNFPVAYLPGKENMVPDLRSRAPIPPASDLPSASPRDGTSSSANSFDVSDSSFSRSIFGPTWICTISKPELATETSNDANLELDKGFLRKGWPRTKLQTPQHRAYFDVQRELSTLDGVVYCDVRLLIPFALRNPVLDLAHKGHCGVGTVKQRYRECPWRP